MADFIVSSRTIDVFFNILSSKSSVNEISELFESEGIFTKLQSILEQENQLLMHM
ncbi:hypothetical protein [Paenibacillus glacialis]|uniref:hypothetical protein n=1 Tax=Paenibacillus glacialis TaxID=494026 RepID=UPI000AC73B37|nr:hypothetical protein [Paenibacillus glacialis]